uniref:LIM domain only 7b n=1 Tax=Iconisemion striatum TaxID=60296 RepID=A0A1A7WWR8_9TELE
MEWRQQSSVSCADAFDEAQRRIEEVTGKSFGCNDFRAALENGVLLCDLINQLKPGVIRRLNRLSTPIAGLDNVNVFLKACGKLGLNESQLFHPGDLQDLSTRVTLRKDESQRRLKNVLITIYWLGRKAQLETFYDARPFGTNQSRVSSLPRFYSADDSRGLLLKSEKENSPPSSPRVSLKRQTAAANLRGQYQASIRQKKASQARLNGSKQREISTVGFSKQTSLQTSILPHQSSTQKLAQPTKLQSSNYKNSTFPSTTNYSQVDYSDMRVSLTLKPNSVPDFGFQTHWGSTGVRVKFIQPGGPAELCQLRVDDEIVAVDGAAVACLTYSQWKDRMTSSLETGSLTMDIRRYGKKDWSTIRDGHPNQPVQSRKTLNLTAAAPVLIGYTDRHANSVAPPETADRQGSKFNWQTDHAVQNKDMDGALSENSHSSRSKDNINVAKTNQKRRADFFNQTGGSESAISDLQVPSLNPSTSNWLWDREEDRRRQEKWQEEQERLLQEQYQRDQERLEAEWQRAQQDALEGKTSQENLLELSSAPERFTSSLFYVNGLTKKSREDDQSPDQVDLKDAAIKRQSSAQNCRNTENDWAEGSCGFTRLSPAHRALSLSTPALSEPHKPPGVDQRRRFGRSMSKAERERQQILEEMKKRTQLLTDNSWIRQRSNSFHKEPIDVAACMKRRDLRLYESLDNLETLHHSPDMAATFTYPRPHSAAGGYGVPTRNAASRYSTGSMLSQKSTHTDSSHLASAWAATDILEEQRLESRSVSETGSPTVITAISYSGPLVLSPCDQYDVLQIEE